MNIYIIKSKVEKIQQAKQDFYDWKGIEVSPFTKKVFFYFFIHEGVKYIHKPSLQFVYSNADTYTYDVDPQLCHLQKEYEILDIFPFLESYKGTVTPKLIEYTDKFVAYEEVVGEPVVSVTEDEFWYLRAQHYVMRYTPFYNSMAYNLVRTENSIKLIDFKHFEERDTKPFFLYFYNQEHNINRLYTEQGTDLDVIHKHLEIDYPSKKADVVYY